MLERMNRAEIIAISRSPLATFSFSIHEKSLFADRPISTAAGNAEELGTTAHHD